MSKPLAENHDDFNWDRFLDMDAVEHGLPHENWQSPHGSKTELVPLGAIALEPNDGHSSGWRTDSLPMLHHQQHPHRVIELGDAERSQSQATDARGNSMYIPPVTSLEEMQTIDSVMANGQNDRSQPGAVIYPHHGMIDYPGLPPMVNADITWMEEGNGEGIQAPLGPFASNPSSLSPPIPPLHMPGPTLAPRHHTSFATSTLLHNDQRTSIEADEDSQLRAALFDFAVNSSQRRSSPRRQKATPFPPFNTPVPEIPGEPFSPPPIFSPISPTSPARRIKPRSRARSQSFTPLPEKQGPCLTCGRNYRTSTSPGRCSRCGLKWERHTAGPPTYILDPSVPDVNAAMEMLYPVSRGRSRMIEDDVQFVVSQPGMEDVWIQKWLGALNTAVPATGSDVKASWAANQQTTFNQKAKMDREGEFSTAFVTARLRALWWEVVVFHGGCEGARSFYPVGGDSAGYSEDLELKFGQRLEAIGEVLKVDKRTVMDVVEGRGVGAFVGNPWGFHRRKDSNNGCNAKKKDVLKRNRGETGTLERRSGVRKRASRASSVGVEDHEDGRSLWSEDEGDLDPDGGPAENA